MNKELIKKYKKEFDWWLEGGAIKVFYLNDGESVWLIPDPDEPNNPWGYSEVLIIINDEYVEFRKALAEGKIVEFNDTFGYQKTDRVYTSIPVNQYRIKPEEPKFKVGDWVRSPTAGIFQIKSQASLDNFHNAYGDWNQWRPQLNEWCWFKTYTNETLILRKWVNSTAQQESLNNNNCEPFIGTLPSYLKN